MSVSHSFIHRFSGSNRKWLTSPHLRCDPRRVQIYTCGAKETRFDWSFKAPEANLFDGQGRQIGTHFGGPTWKIDDGSAVVDEVIARADAPEPGAIQWLLLRAKSHEGSGILSPVA